MDGVALASVISSAVVGLTGVGAALWSTHRTAKTARESRVQQRKADSYLEVLRLVELAAQWAEARGTNMKIEAEEALPGLEIQVPVPEKPATDARAVIAAHLAAFGSDVVRQRYATWHERMEAIDQEYRDLFFYWREGPGLNGPVDLDRLKPLLDGLLPAEAAARKLLAEAIAVDINHR